MVVLGIQVAFAAVASFRGWGFTPWGIVLGLLVAGLIFGEGMVWALGAGVASGVMLTLDGLAAAVLGVMAFVSVKDTV